MRFNHQNVIERATSVFGDREKSIIWLNSPCYALGNQVPMQLTETTEGMGLVMSTLGRIKHGIFV